MTPRAGLRAVARRLDASLMVKAALGAALPRPRRSPAMDAPIKRAIVARAGGCPWDGALRSYVESVEGVSLPSLAAELTATLGRPVAHATLERLREEAYLLQLSGDAA